MSRPLDGQAFQSLVVDHAKTMSQVSVKAVGSQLVLMTTISVGTLLAFSFFRPREKKVYAPKVKYQQAKVTRPVDDSDYEPPPPPISNGFFAWFSPVIHLKEEQMIQNIGLDAATFLRFLRMLRSIFTVICAIAVALMVVNIIYNMRNVAAEARTALSLLTIQNVSGSWAWPALAGSYLINFIVMYFIWRNWRTMVSLRSRWFRSPAYQHKIYSRTLMVTQIRKDYRSDAGLLALMGQLKVDGIKIGPEIDCTSIGRRLEDFPEMVEKHNEAVAELEGHLTKYLKGNQLGKKRPTLKEGATLGIGGQKRDAIDHLAQKIHSLRDRIDAKRQAIDSLIKTERRARKQGKQQAGPKIQGENYGFVTFKTIAEAHRIARSHRGKLPELFGARLQLAPMPHDVVWQNISREPGEIASRTTFGFVLIGLVCFFNTIPLLVVSLLANLSSLTLYVDFLGKWKDAGSVGNWTFSVVSGVLPSVVSAAFGYFLPYIIRRISKYQGAPTRTRLDRAVTARYFFFIIISNLFVFSLLGVVYNIIAEVVLQIGQHQGASAIFAGLKEIPGRIQGTYVQQSTYWLTWLPLRGFLIIFELIQLIKLAMVSLRRLMFSHTPREIRDMTKPAYFEYSIVVVNMLWVCAVGLIYAPLAPLVTIGATLAFWFSSVVYKYQLLYVYVSRAESGGRMWNVYVNRLIACAVLMQLLMVLTTGLIRRRWLDSVAAAPPLLCWIGFKIWLDKTAGQEFRYYVPTPEEAQNERYRHDNEKHTKASEVEKRFLHPALQADKLYTIMVHKEQEHLAKEVLSAYPWFNKVKAVREENLEYDPLRDGPREQGAQAEWDAKSHASTDMLKSEAVTPFMTPGADDNDSLYKQYPFPAPGLPLDNPSTDHLLPTRSRAEDYNTPRRPSQPLPSSFGRSEGEPIVTSPLLDHSFAADQAQPRSQGQGHGQEDYVVPYPPTSFNQSPPHGYTPPGMRRQNTDYSDSSDIGAPSYRTHAQGQGQVSYGGYDDPYQPYEPRRQGSRDELGGNGYGGPRRQGSRDELGGYGRM